MELRQQIVSHLDTKSFQAFRLSTRQLNHGTFSDLLKRGSRYKRVWLIVADLQRMTRFLEDVMFVAVIDTIVFYPCKYEPLSTQHWSEFWTLLAKIKSIHATGRTPIKIKVLRNYKGDYRKCKFHYREGIHNLEGCSRLKNLTHLLEV